MAGLPKKYAKMGFKKGWAAYNRSKKSTSSPVKRRKTKTKYVRKTMAKKKTTRRKANNSMKIFGVNVAKMGAPVGYGMLRGKTSAMIAPYVQKLPFGNIGDEVGMILLGRLAKKFVFKKAGLSRNVINDGEKIELARIGDAIINGQVQIPFLSNLGNQAAAPSNNGYVFA